MILTFRLYKKGDNYQIIEINKVSNTFVVSENTLASFNSLDLEGNGYVKMYPLLKMNIKDDVVLKCYSIATNKEISLSRYGIQKIWDNNTIRTYYRRIQDSQVVCPA